MSKYLAFEDDIKILDTSEDYDSADYIDYILCKMMIFNIFGVTPFDDSGDYQWQRWLV